MLLCPLDYRYGRDEIRKIFSEEYRLSLLLRVEAALARAQAAVGNIPEEAAAEIASRATTEHVSLARVKEIERETKHDIMAMVKALTEQCGEAGRYVHLGATSNDIIDTANALVLKEALDLIEKDLRSLALTLASRAKAHRRTLMAGRTHGQFAIPITFGFKMAGYLSETLRHLERLRQMRERVLVGKMSGAVGTGAAFGPKFPEIQRNVMRQLGLREEEAATQVVCRDRYTELIGNMAAICTSCERYATEVRNLQRSEIREVSEAFDTENQVGSSTMAHKKNPITSENICGLARIVRAFVAPTMENMVLWHERDLTNSSSERFILPHVLVLTDDILVKMNLVFARLAVDAKRMRENLESARGMVMAEAVMIALTERGMGRQEAHELVRRCSMDADERDAHLRQVLSESEEVRALMSEEDLERIMDPASYLGHSIQIVDETVAHAERLLSVKI